MPENVKTITIYSTRGGSGKTLTAIMLAVAGEKLGKKALIIDVDLEAPSLLHLVKPANRNFKSWVDYIEGDVQEVLELPQKTYLPNIDVIYSPSPVVGRAFLDWRSHDWWKEALKRTILAQSKFLEHGYDLIIFDNQSGTSLNSVNNLVVADASIMVMRPSSYGLGATSDIVKNIYNTLKDMKQRTDYYLWNQILSPSQESSKEKLNNFISKWDETLNSYGLIKAGMVYFNNDLNLELLAEKPHFLNYFDGVSETYFEILKRILD